LVTGMAGVTTPRFFNLRCPRNGKRTNAVPEIMNFSRGFSFHHQPLGLS